MRTVIPWLKTALDPDTRYSRFRCPALPDNSGVSHYRSTGPLP